MSVSTHEDGCRNRLCNDVRVSIAPPEVTPEIDFGSLTHEQTGESEQTTLAWTVVVWNDPINLMSYVTWVFMTHFAYSREEAERLMWQVHNDGKSVVNSGGREQMERDVQAMHGYGLWATLEQGG